jgi:hypothetical protein
MKWRDELRWRTRAFTGFGIDVAPAYQHALLATDYRALIFKDSRRRFIFTLEPLSGFMELGARKCGEFQGDRS